MKILLLFIINLQIACAYTDPELEALWSSLSDITNPTLDDYALIELYIQNGKRPYLKSLYDTTFLYNPTQEMSEVLDTRILQKRNFKLVGPNGEMPICELHNLNVTEKTKDRCILIYASYNAHYPEKLLFSTFEELKNCGYSGHVMIRIGGFPNLAEGGLKFSPFSLWKNEFIKEALRMGFTKILHIDTSVHPLTNLNSVFEILDSKGYYLVTSGYVTPHLCYHQHLDYLKIDKNQKIDWLPGFIIGFNFSNEKAVKLFWDWDRATRDFEHFIYWDTDEVAMTILAWQQHLSPTGYHQEYDFSVDSWR